MFEPDQHPVHQRHHRLPQGRDADPPQHPEQRLFIGECMKLTPDDRCASPCRCTTASAWCWAIWPASPTAAPWSPQRCVRPAGGVAGGAGRALHRPARRADHVHRRAGPPALCRVRPAHPAHRHHGRLALPGGGDEAGAGRHAHGRGDHCLRHDRDQPGELPERTDTPLDKRVATVGRCSRTWR
jgi:hypothetical protein